MIHILQKTIHTDNSLIGENPLLSFSSPAIGIQDKQQRLKIHFFTL